MENEPYKIETRRKYNHIDNKIRLLKKYGDLNTVFNFSDIQQFVANYQRSSSDEVLDLVYENEETELGFECYIPENVEDVLGYIDPQKPSLVRIHEIDYTELMEYTRLDMKLFNNEIESIKTLIIDEEGFEDFDKKVIDQYNVKSLRCEVNPMTSLKNLDDVKIPISLKLFGDFELHKPVCKTTVSLQFTCVDETVIQDLSYLHDLEELTIDVIHEKVTDFDVKFPESLKELRIRCDHEFVYKKSHNQPNVLRFPKGLKLLVLQNMKIPKDTDLGSSLEELGLINSTDGLDFPPNLKKGKFCYYHPSEPQIPHDLEELSLFLKDTLAPDLEKFSNLKKLLIEAGGADPSNIKLPENLEILVLRDDTNIYTLNDNLIDLAMNAPTDSKTLQTKSFPASLKYAQLTDCDLKWVNDLPSTLEFLEIEGGHSWETEFTFPSGLKALKLRDKSLGDELTLPENLQLFTGFGFNVSQGFINKLPKGLDILSLSNSPWGDDDTFIFDFSDYQLTDLELGFPSSSIEKLILPGTLKTLLLPNCDLNDLEFLDTSKVTKVYATFEMEETKVFSN